MFSRTRSGSFPSAPNARGGGRHQKPGTVARNCPRPWLTGWSAPKCGAGAGCEAGIAEGADPDFVAAGRRIVEADHRIERPPRRCRRRNTSGRRAPLTTRVVSLRRGDRDDQRQRAGIVGQAHVGRAGDEAGAGRAEPAGVDVAAGAAPGSPWDRPRSRSRARARDKWPRAPVSWASAGAAQRRRKSGNKQDVRSSSEFS